MEVRNNISNVVKKIEDGTRLAGKTMDTAGQINVRTQKSNENTMKIYDEIKELSEEAFEKSKYSRLIRLLILAIKQFLSVRILKYLSLLIFAPMA